MKVAYPAVIHHENDSYWAEFPDVPGCFCWMDTLPEVIAEAEHVLGSFLCEIMDGGQPLPQASNAAIMKPEDGIVTLIATDPYQYKKKTRAVKKTLSIPEWLNEEAEKRHINFSSVLKDALLAEIG